MKKYTAIFKINLLNSLAYPAELLFRSLMILIFMWVFFQLWSVTYSSSGNASISGLTLQDTIWYLLLAETIELGRPRLARSIAQQVRDGSIAYLLNKPYDLILYQLASGLGESVPRMAMLFLLGGGLVWLLAGPPPALVNWPLAAIAVAGAWLLHFIFNTLIGLAAFVAEEVAPFEWIYSKLGFMLGGLLIPLDFYPAWLQTIARNLPFAYMTYGPARIFVQPDPQIFGSILLGQVVWIAVIGSLLFLSYSLGMRRLALNGG